MASFTEKILVKIDVAADKATAGLKDFKKSVGEAEGFTGKLKAGTSSLSNMFTTGGVSTAAMAGGVTALGAAAFKAVSDFSDLGVEIGNFATATGLSTEQSSRWVEVASDLGIETETLQSLIGKLNKNIDPKKFADLGIAISHTATGATDVNATFLNVIQRLHEIQDPAERARVGAQLLGKGWQSAAELIGMSADDIKKRLAGVSKEQVLTDKQVQDAKDFRDAQDALMDVFKRLTITIGSKLAPALSDVADLAAKFGDAFGWVNDIDQKLSGGKNAIDGIEESLGWAADTADSLWDSWYKFTFGADEATKQTVAGVDTLTESMQAQQYVADLIAKNAAYKKSLEDDAEAAGRAKDATNKLRDSIEDLNNIQLDAIDTRLDVVTQSLDLMKAQEDYNQSVEDGKTPVTDLAIAANDLAQKQADLAKQQGIANGHTQTAAERTGILLDKYNDLQKTLEPGSPLWNAIEAYKDALLKIPTNISTRISITGAGAGNAGRLAPGAGQGPDGTRSTPNGITVNVNAGLIADKETVGRHITEAIHREYKNGTRYPWMGGN